jgi:SAM-dependent methyltransferase
VVRQGTGGRDWEECALTRQALMRMDILNLLRGRRQGGLCETEARYRLGVSSNLFSGVLPEGIYYPDYTTLEDHRPLEFISIAGRALAKPWKRCTILDVGCGEGTSTIAIGRTGARVIGIEGRPEVVARANYLRGRLGYTNVEFRTGDVLDRTLWEKADGVFASGLIHHLERPFRLMELIGEHCSELAYFCTHLAPRDEAQRAASFFASVLHEAGSVEFRGRALPGIRFAEGGDAREATRHRRRHPRAGIGNTYSWWPAEESFAAAMKEVGFPHMTLLAGNDHRLRYRLCFRRGGGGPAAGSEPPAYLWDGPERPSPEAALERTLASDISFLKAAAVSPALLGTWEMVERMRERLLLDGIRPSVAYLCGTQPAIRRVGDLETRPHDTMAKDRPEFVVIACDRIEDVRRHVGELVTLRTCQYSFTSFTLPEIREWPPLTDPVTGESLAARFSSGLSY